MTLDSPIKSDLPREHRAERTMDFLSALFVFPSYLKFFPQISLARACGYSTEGTRARLAQRSRFLLVSSASGGR